MHTLSSQTRKWTKNICNGKFIWHITIQQENHKNHKSVPRENHFSFQIFFWFYALIATTNGKFSKLQKFCVYMHITKSKCVVSWLFNLFFVKDKVEKHCSSLTLPKTMAIDNSTSFNHSESLWKIFGCWSPMPTFMSMNYNLLMAS